MVRRILEHRLTKAKAGERARDIHQPPYRRDCYGELVQNGSGTKLK